ncbi:MAG TPA: S1 family peptidase, partial [Microlunatus sp.]
MPRARLRSAGTAAIALAVGGLMSAVLVAPAQADPAGSGSPSDAAVRALAQHLDIGVGEARQRVADEAAASRLGAELSDRLGDATAGNYVDSRGQAVVNVTSAAAAATVRAGGAHARWVTNSLTILESTRAALDDLADRGGAGQTQSWGIDIVHNRIRVVVAATAEDAQTRSFLTAARAAGPVSVIDTEATMRSMSGLSGGEQIDFDEDACSIGFNALDADQNPVLLTAGHCGQEYATFSRDGLAIGTTTNYTFPGSGDYAEVPVSNGYWTARAAAGSGTRVQTVSGADEVAPGASICTIGRTTGWSCGTVGTIDNTVNYDNGDGSTSTVTGLTATTACAEPGDSGG